MHLEQKEKIGNHKPMPVRDGHLHLFRSLGKAQLCHRWEGNYACTIGGKRCGIIPTGLGNICGQGPLNLVKEKYINRIRDPFRCCELATNPLRIYYIYNIIDNIYIYVEGTFMYRMTGFGKNPSQHLQ